MIGGIVFSALGTIAVAFSLLEIAAHFFDAAKALRQLVRKLVGLPESKSSGMETAMFWVQILGLLFIGGILMAAGYSTLGA